MTTAGPKQDRWAAWFGGWLVVVLALTPLLAWAGPLGFAALAGVAGALCLPALNVTDEDRPAYVAVLFLLIWAAGSTLWSPHHHGLWGSPAVKLTAEAGFYFALVCAAGRADAGGRTLALRVLAWGMPLLGIVLLAEALTGAQGYQALRTLIGDPERADLARKNVAQGLFVLALLWPVAAVAAVRVGAGVWLVAPMIAALAGGSFLFGYDAPVLALVTSIVAGGAVWAWPRVAPRGLAVLVAAYFLAMPGLVLILKTTGQLQVLKAEAPLSWSQRLGYWEKTVDWMADHPLRGWGLEASRMFSPGIQLHPHNSALQIWLELGLIGAVAAAVFWAALFARLGAGERDPARAAAAATAAAYVVFGAVSFGVWQEWWLALGGIAAACGVALVRQPAPETTAGLRKSSTFAAISE